MSNHLKRGESEVKEKIVDVARGGGKGAHRGKLMQRRKRI